MTVLRKLREAVDNIPCKSCKGTGQHRYTGVNWDYMGVCPECEPEIKSVTKQERLLLQHVALLVEQAEAVREWANVECTHVMTMSEAHTDPDAVGCYGENHAEDCPVMIALQDMITVKDKIETP